MPQQDQQTRRESSPCKRRGFTLIELLVVVSLIAMLIAILLPAIGSARDSSRVLQCTSNTRQIAVAWTMYLQEHDETFPEHRKNMQWFYGGREPALGIPAFQADHRPLNPYVGLAETDSAGLDSFRCTADRDIRNGNTGGTGPTQGHSTYTYFGNSYMMNASLLWQKDESGEIQRVRLSDVRLPPSQVAASGDVQWYYAVLNTHWDAHFHNDHDQVNLSFLDGHASYVQIERGSAYTPDYSFLRERPETQ
ncbi:MAG: type II secretion system protein [Planctomycetota bacterium]